MKRKTELPAFLLEVLILFTLATGCGNHDTTPKAPEIPGLSGNKHRTYYEIYVRSFFDGNGDGTGDFKGLLQKLDYLNTGVAGSTDDLKITGIWLMPVTASPSEHKYDVTNYTAIDTEYGTMGDFEAFVAACARRDVAVIMDLVLNHSSAEHPWFQSASKSVVIEPCGHEPCSEPGLCREHNPCVAYYNFVRLEEGGQTPAGWAPITQMGKNLVGVTDAPFLKPDITDDEGNLYLDDNGYIFYCDGQLYLNYNDYEYYLADGTPVSFNNALALFKEYVQPAVTKYYEPLLDEYGNPVLIGGNPIPDHNREADSGEVATGWIYEAYFTPAMPDLNLDNAELRKEIAGIGRFWLEKGLAGFRLDAAKHYYDKEPDRNNGFLRWFISEMREIKKDVYIVGEVWDDQAAILDYYGSGLDSLFNFPFAAGDGAILSHMREGTGARFAEKMADWQTRIRAANPDAIDAPFLSDHDQDRIGGSVPDPESYKMAASVYLLMPGNPFIYYGEELGMIGGGANTGDVSKRMPMIWSRTNQTGIPKSPWGADISECEGADAQSNNPESLLSFYRQVIRQRGSFPVLASGAITVIDTGSDAICAYRIEKDGESAVVVHNFSRDTITLDGFTENLTLAAQLCADGGEVSAGGGSLVMTGFSTVILKR